MPAPAVMSSPTALVTAGGTSQYLDDVRKITNISNGTFGVEIARALERSSDGGFVPPCWRVPSVLPD